MHSITHSSPKVTTTQQNSEQFPVDSLSADNHDSGLESAFGAPLGNTDRIRVPPPSKRIASSRFVQHLEMRERVQKITPYHKVSRCGFRQIDSSQPVVVGRRSDLGRVGFQNTRYCNSVWCCPTCGAIIQSRRIAEISSAMAKRPDLGTIHATITLQHAKGDSLALLIDHLLSSWRFVASGAPAKRWRDRNGIVGFFRVLEAPSGENGWHPHLHISIVHKMGAANAEDVESFIRKRYSSHLAKLGGYVSQAHGLKFRTDSHKLAAYFDKLQDESKSYSAAPLKELMTIYKTSASSLHPFDLARLAHAGDKQALALWSEYVSATKGRAWMTVSPALRAELGLGEELPDEELLNDEMTHYAQLIAIHARAWRELRWIPGFIPSLGAAALAFNHPRELVRWLLDTYGAGLSFDLNGKDDAPAGEALSWRWCWIVDDATEELPAVDPVKEADRCLT